MLQDRQSNLLQLYGDEYIVSTLILDRVLINR